MKRTEKEPTFKLFFALWPNAAECAALGAWQPALRELCGGDIMLSDTLHATLVFLGEVAVHRLGALRLAAQETPFRSFDLCLSSARYWGHNHIVYASPDAVPAALSRFVQDLQGNLRKRSFHFDARPYQPHVTLIRHGGWKEEVFPPMPPVCWQVRDFVLVRSLGAGRGARYEILARFVASELE